MFKFKKFRLIAPKKYERWRKFVSRARQTCTKNDASRASDRRVRMLENKKWVSVDIHTTACGGSASATAM